MPSSKRYQASYIGPDLARHYAPGTFGTRMDAERWLGDERRLIDQDIWTSPKQRAAQRQAEAVTLNTYADRWIEQRNVKPGTKIEYRRLKAQLITDTIGKVVLRNLTPDAVRAWYAALGTKTPRRNSHAYGLLHAICATAVTDQLIASNPCIISRAMNPVRKREPVILSIDEMARVVDAIQPERYRCLVLVAAWCGLRWGEVTELRRKDIDELCEVISVTRAVTHRGSCRIDTTKSGKARAVVVPPHIRADLKHHLEVHVAKSPDTLLFSAMRGGCHLDDWAFARSVFSPALKTVGREGVRIHDLRHFAGTQTARVGNLVETMNRLGHSTVKASLTYQAMVSGRDREVAEALSALAYGSDANTTV
ncbi:site-specific integrase [Mycobacterium aquaticum]